MATLVHEKFDPDWEARNGWSGHGGYDTPTAGVSGTGLRVLFREGSHYGMDRRKSVVPSDHVRLSFHMGATYDWNSHETGKLIGFGDLRWEDAEGRTLGYGNRPPRPDGFSFRTWFGPTEVDGTGKRYVPVGAYVYHAGQAETWGDHIRAGRVYIDSPAFTKIEVETNLRQGWLRMRVGDDTWFNMDITVGDRTKITTAWLNGYYGHSGLTAPSKFAADFDEYLLEALHSEPSEEEPLSAITMAQVIEQLRTLADQMEAAG